MRPRRSSPFYLALALALVGSAPAARAQQIPTPEQFFGFQMGADRKLARWDKLVAYYQLLDSLSPRVHVENMGPSTLGNPFLAIWVSAPDNLTRLDEIQRMNALLSDPRGKAQAEVDAAIANGQGGGGAVLRAALDRGGREPERRRRSSTRWPRGTTPRCGASWTTSWPS